VRSIRPPMNRLPERTEGLLGFDTEYAPNGDLLTVALADRSRSYALDRDTLSRDKFDASILEGVTLAGHNIPGDVDYLVALGVACPGLVTGRLVRDTYLEARLLNENLVGKGAYSLLKVFQACYDFPDWKAETAALGVDATQWPLEARMVRCRLDAWASCVLAHRFADRLPRNLRTFVNLVSLTCHRVLLTKCVVDMPRMKKLGDQWKADAAKYRELLVRQAYGHGMKTFSPTNDGNLRTLLYKKLKLPITRRTKKKQEPAVDQYTLGQLDHPAVKLLLAFNKADKLASSWYGRPDRTTSKATPLIELIEPWGAERGLLVAKINQLGTRTGRRSSGGKDEDGVTVGKNMQNWPPVARGMIVSRYDGGLILSADYSKLEPCLFAWVAKDEALLDVFQNRGGYAEIARKMLGKVVEKDTREYRVIKETVLGVHYYAGAFRIAEQLWFKLGIRLAPRWPAHMAKCDEFRKQYLRLFPGVKRYFAARREELAANESVTCLTGFVRHLPGYRSATDKWVRKHLLNEAINAPIQHLASAVTGAALVDCEAALLSASGVSYVEHHSDLLRRNWDRTLILNEVHDEIVFDVHPRHAKRDERLIVEAMEAVPTLRKLCPTFDLKLKVEVKKGPRWSK
jgi:DNA polymerase I-like protein with 3'-5' exonuclease and polymerase domains